MLDGLAFGAVLILVAGVLIALAERLLNTDRKRAKMTEKEHRARKRVPNPIGAGTKMPGEALRHDAKRTIEYRTGPENGHLPGGDHQGRKLNGNFLPQTRKLNDQPLPPDETLKMTADAIKHYHSLLEGSLADDAIAKLKSGVDRYNLRFGSQPICSVLRPMLVSEQQYEQVRRDSTLVLSAIETLYRALMADSKLRAELMLTPDEERLISLDPGFDAPDASGRLDGFFDSRGGFQFVEYNADSPGGLLYGDALGEIFMEMEVAREFSRKRPLRRVPIRPRLLETLLYCYQKWGGYDRPRIAIVDWDDVKTQAEFEICQEYFQARGYPTIIADPKELEYRGGWLRVRDFQIDLVYKRVVTGELLERGGSDHPLLQAAQARAVCVVNSFHVQMLMKKAIFALLDDPAYEHLFPAREREALRRRIPWTRVLRDGFTTHQGKRVDLMEFVARNREILALKPNGDYGGRGVVLGWEVGDYAWTRALKEVAGAPYVVQERVEVLKESFPILVNGKVVFEDRYLDFDPYSWCGDDVDGAGVRLSKSALLNVTAGGGSAAPMMIIEG
ncbi:MAG: hypothetical protein AB7U82_08790 [Blastocatellales bacterium]